MLETSDYYPFGLQVQRAGSTTTSPENSYKYNGKELQTEMGLGQYDYGARFYDPVVGRFNTIDPMSGLYNSESLYVYAGNSPIRYVDEGGLFKIDAHFAREYPTLAKMLKYVLPMLKSNQKVRSVFKKITGLGDSDFDQMVSYGSGPWITPTRPELSNWTNQTNPAYGDNSQYAGDMYPDHLFINSVRLKQLEQAMKAGGSDEARFRMFMASLTIMHEASHYGLAKRVGVAGEKESIRNFDETGARFEQGAFIRVSYTNKQNEIDWDRARSYYNSSLMPAASIGMVPTLNSIMTLFNNLPKPEPSKAPDKVDPELHPRPRQ